MNCADNKFSLVIRRFELSVEVFTGGEGRVTAVENNIA